MIYIRVAVVVCITKASAKIRNVTLEIPLPDKCFLCVLNLCWVRSQLASSVIAAGLQYGFQLLDCILLDAAKVRVEVIAAKYFIVDAELITYYIIASCIYLRADGYGFKVMASFAARSKFGNICRELA